MATAVKIVQISRGRKTRVYMKYNLRSSIGPRTRKAILADLRSGLDEHNALYIRLSKQVLVMNGAAVLASSDPIRVRVKPRSFLVKGDPAAFYERLFGRSAR